MKGNCSFDDICNLFGWLVVQLSCGLVLGLLFGFSLSPPPLLSLAFYSSPFKTISSVSSVVIHSFLFNFATGNSRHSIFCLFWLHLFTSSFVKCYLFFLFFAAILISLNIWKQPGCVCLIYGLILLI